MKARYKEIENQIVKGLKNTCIDAINFNGTFDATVRPEYLITVNIAKSISELNLYPGSPYLVRPEESTERLATRSVPSMIWDDIFLPATFSSMDLNTYRNGRVDIAVYYENTDTPLTAIEVKLVNPTSNEIKDDILRLVEFLHFQDKTGSSRIQHTYFSCVEFNPEIKFIEDVQADLLRIKTKYQAWVTDILNGREEDTKFEIAVLNIDDSLLLTPNSKTGDDIFDSDLHYQAKYYAGVVIRFTKK